MKVGPRNSVADDQPTAMAVDPHSIRRRAREDNRAAPSGPHGGTPSNKLATRSTGELVTLGLRSCAGRWPRRRAGRGSGRPAARARGAGRPRCTVATSGRSNSALCTYSRMQSSPWRRCRSQNSVPRSTPSRMHVPTGMASKDRPSGPSWNGSSLPNAPRRGPAGSLRPPGWLPRASAPISGANQAAPSLNFPILLQGNGDGATQHQRTVSMAAQRQTGFSDARECTPTPQGRPSVPCFR